VDLTEKMAPYRDQIAPAKFFEIEKDGRLYGVPSDPPPGAFIYRADIFEEAGVGEIPGKWEELLKVVGEKVVKPGERYLFGMDGENSPTFYWWRPLAAQLSSGYYDYNGNIAIDSPQAARVTKFMYDAQNTYQYALKGVNYWESPAWWSALKENKVVAAIAAPWMIAMLKQEVPEQSGKWKAIPMPVWDDGNPNSAELGGASVVIPKTSKNQEAAWKFLEYACLSQEGCVQQYKTGGIWPSYLPAFADPVFEEDDAYFGMKLNKLFGDLTKVVSGVYYTRNFAEIDHNVVRPHLFKIFNDQEKLEEGLKAAAEEMKAFE
jgi:lactose/L-arabinose transport system substrate-binding protein